MIAIPLIKKTESIKQITREVCVSGQQSPNSEDPLLSVRLNPLQEMDTDAHEQESSQLPISAPVAAATQKPTQRPTQSSTNIGSLAFLVILLAVLVLVAVWLLRKLRRKQSVERSTERSLERSMERSMERSIEQALEQAPTKGNICPQCRGQFPSRALYCPKDGTKLEKSPSGIELEGRLSIPAPTEGRACPKCHRGYPGDARFCPHDGQKLQIYSQWRIDHRQD